MRRDDLDARIVELLTDNPRISGVDAAAELGIARSTYQSRLERLLADGVVSLAPHIDPERAGFFVTAFISTEIRQSNRSHGVIEHLVSIPEVIEVHTVTGGGDLLVRVVTRSNRELQQVIDRIATHDDVLHTATSIALANPMPLRTSGLVRLGLSVDETQ